jgi:6-methylsalicylate decarboxylase
MYKPKIDLHVHYLTDAYREGLIGRGESNPDGFPTPHWDPESHLEAMKNLRITTSMLAISSPHVNFGDETATKLLARKVNDYGAEVVKKYPGKFGLLASLPLPNVKDSIEEIHYACDILNADGFTLPTNTQGIYLGNPSLDPIFEELNKKSAVVVLHPNKPSAVPENVVTGLAIPMMEYFFDTTRTVLNMIFNGITKRFPELKIIIPHAGAVLPIIADRIAPVVLHDPAFQVDINDELKKFYYDLGGVRLPRQITRILQLVDTDRLFYGSDYPYTPEFMCQKNADMLDQTDVITQEQREAIYFGNASALFARKNNLYEVIDGQ